MFLPSEAILLHSNPLVADCRRVAETRGSDTTQIKAPSFICVNSRQRGMRTARFYILAGFFLTVAIVVSYKILSSGLTPPELQQARIAYETAKIQLEQARLEQHNALETERLRIKQMNLQRVHDVSFYGVLALIGTCGLSLMILAIGHNRTRARRASVYFARIGQHSEIPVHQKDLEQFYPIAVNLSLAELEASTSTTHDRAYRISRHILQDISEYTRALAGKRGMLTSGSGHAEPEMLETATHTATPSCAELLQCGMMAQGKSLVIGYDQQGQPQYRSLKDLKSLAVAGWQGSGKTFSMGYLVAASVLTYGVHAYIIDPHKHHPESLAALLKPLERTGHITVINPFDTPALLDELNRKLDRRLAGEEITEPGILVVIDELARLAKTECFDGLVTFLERCTEETRKANITFIGGSPKWTARHFKGRADIRKGINAMLIHKMKPSQAELLLEDTYEKHLVKHLQRPGQAILVTDYEPPRVIAVPFCTQKDMEAIADLVEQAHQTASEIYEDRSDGRPQKRPDFDTATAQQAIARPLHSSETRHEMLNQPGVPPEKPGAWPGVISLAQHRKHHQRVHPGIIDPMQLTVEMLREQFQRRKAQDPAFTQTVLARQVGISQSHVSRILSGERPLGDQYKQAFYEALFDSRWSAVSEKVTMAFHPPEARKTATR